MINILKELFSMLKNYHKRLYAGIMLSMIGHLLSFVPIIFGIYILQKMSLENNGAKSLTSSDIIIMTVIIMISILIRWFIAYLRAILQDTIAHEYTTSERIKIGNILKRVSLGFLQNNRIGELNTAITTDLAFFEIHCMNVINNLVDSYLFIILTIIGLAFISPLLSIISFIAVLISTISLQLIQYQSRINAPVRQEAVQEMASEIIQYVRGMAIVKSFKQEGVASDGLFQSFKKSKDINLKMERNYAPFDALHRLSLNLGTTLIIFFSSLSAIEGTLKLPIALMLIVYSFIIFSNIESADKSLHLIEMLHTISIKLKAIEETQFIDSDGQDIHLNAFDIQFNNVSFGYDSRIVLSDLSFKIPTGTMTAIIGPSGSGKSTICHLIARFYDVNQGNISIGNHDVKAFTCNSLLKNISMVFQNVYLFNDTIRNNIKFGNPEATDDELIKAAQAAQCHEFISKLPNGYDTIINEAGASLSGGEKQRISIARAILKNAPIVILDEATASIDPENEHLIQEAISSLTQNKTIIVIAHRLATIEHADQILVIDDGKLVQKGTHQQLIEQQGLYRRFIEIRKTAESWTLT